MKNITLLLLILLLNQSNLFSQSCLPGETILNTQEDIDNFQTNYPGCTEIEGSLYITGDNIHNLEGLNVLTTIGGNLTIINGDSINNLSGLNNINSIGGKLSIAGVDRIKNLAGLEGLTNINGMLEIVFLDSLLNLTGMNSLSYVGGSILIHTNPLLSDLSGIENLSATGGGLSIYNNSNLGNLNDLQNLTSIGDYITISDNDILESLSGIDNIDPGSITNLSITENDNLSTCEVQSICDYLANPSGTITISNNNTGCNTYAEVETACENVSIEEFETNELFEIFPNPANNRLTIKNKQNLKIIEVNIFNQLGEKLCIEKSIYKSIDISRLDKGLYIIEIKVDRNKYRKKLIVK